jgi:hypothetical protein
MLSLFYSRTSGAGFTMVIILESAAAVIARSATATTNTKTTSHPVENATYL